MESNKSFISWIREASTHGGGDARRDGYSDVLAEESPDPPDQLSIRHASVSSEKEKETYTVDSCIKIISFLQYTAVQKFSIKV